MPKKPKTKVFIKQDDLLASEKKVLANLYNKTDDLINKYNELKETLDLLEFEDTLRKAAKVMAVESIIESAIEIVQHSALEAAVRSVEFNYEPYIVQLMGAIERNIGNVINYNPDLAEPFSIDFSPLGDIQEWASAVEQARKELNIGKITNIEVASHIWAEKIYGVDREGNRIIVTKAGGETEDITDRYIGLYDLTLQVRLDFLEPDKAPFWEILEYGNLNIDMKGEGIPYPTVSPTGFTKEAAYLINYYYSRVYTDYIDKVDKWISDLVKKDHDVEGGGGDLEKGFIEVVNEDAEERIKRVVEEIIETEEYKRYEERKTIRFVKEVNRAYDTYRSGEAIHTRYRVKGKFATLEQYLKSL